MVPKVEIEGWIEFSDQLDGAVLARKGRLPDHRPGPLIGLGTFLGSRPSPATDDDLDLALASEIQFLLEPAQTYRRWDQLDSPLGKLLPQFG